MVINRIKNALLGKINGFWDWVDKFYPRNAYIPPDFCVPEPLKIEKDKQIIQETNFDITENVCGLTITYGLFKRLIGTHFVIYNDKNAPIKGRFSQMNKVLADILKHYNAESVFLQVKVLENDNYYKIKPKILATYLYIDYVECDLKEMISILSEYKIDTVPVLMLSEKINEKTKEKYSAKSMLADVESKGLICRNKQKSLSFLL